MRGNSFIPRDYDVFTGLDVSKKSMSVTFTNHQGFIRSLNMRGLFRTATRRSAWPPARRRDGTCRVTAHPQVSSHGATAWSDTTPRPGLTARGSLRALPCSRPRRASRPA